MGKVFLVGAGPGDPELLTRKAARVLEEADVVLFDSLVSAEVLQLVSPTAELVDVGKRAGLKLLTQDEINSLLVAYAGRYETVVRLKGGDPMLFGRAAEEIDVMDWLGGTHSAGVTEEVVGLGRYGKTLTVLSSEIIGQELSELDDESEDDDLRDRWTPRFRT